METKKHHGTDAVMQREHIASHPYAGITRIRSEGLQRHYAAISADFASAPLGIKHIIAPMEESVKLCGI